MLKTTSTKVYRQKGRSGLSARHCVMRSSASLRVLPHITTPTPGPSMITPCFMFATPKVVGGMLSPARPSWLEGDGRDVEALGCFAALG